MDMATDLERSLVAVENACVELQMPQRQASAEATLLAFRKSPEVLLSSQYILEKSQNPMACFQAATALQEASLRLWPFLQPSQQMAVQLYCLHYVMAGVQGRASFVHAKMVAGLASLIKRGWLDNGGSRSELLSKVEEALGGIGGCHKQLTAIAICQALVLEFTTSSATTLGLAPDFHKKCRQSLEVNWLPRCFSAVQAAAVAAVACIPTNGTDGARSPVCEVAAASLHLMATIATWELDSSANAKVWAELLAGAERVHWLLGLYTSLRQRGPLWNFSPLGDAARELVVLLCSLPAHLFPPGNNTAQQDHVQRLLEGVASWLAPPAGVVAAVSAGEPASELLDACQALGALLKRISKASPDHHSSCRGAVAELLGDLSQEVILRGGSTGDGPLAEVFQALMDAWALLLLPSMQSAQASVNPRVKDAATQVFRVFVSAQLADATAGANEDESETEHLPESTSARDERLTLAAAIARCSALPSLALLAELVGQRLAALPGATAEGLEELHWLVLMSGHTLADSCAGETPQVPPGILDIQVREGDMTSHPAVDLSRQVLSLCETSIQAAGGTAMLSPRVVEVFIWFLARWAPTYLLTDSSSTQGDQKWLAAFEGSQGVTVLELVLRCALAALTAWQGERNLQELVCRELLPVLVRRRKVATHLLTLEPWKQLALAFSQGNPTLSAMAGPLQRTLAESLCQAAAAAGSQDDCGRHVGELLQLTVQELQALSWREDLAAMAQRGPVVVQLSCILQRLRGAARSTQPRTQPALFALGCATMEPLLILLKVYSNQPFIVTLILKLSRDWAAAQIPFLGPSETATLFSYCMNLLRLYSAQNIGKISLESSSSLANNARDEKYSNMRALLHLLATLTSKAFLDFADQPSPNQQQQSSNDVQEVAFLGLHIVAPLVTLDLQKYPKVARQYFALLEHLVGAYPERLAHLPTEAMQRIASSLEMGIHHQDSDVAALALEAVASLALFEHHKSLQGVAFNRVQQGILASFLHPVLHVLLFTEAGMEVVEPAADALLVLILCEPNTYQMLVEEIVAKNIGPDAQSFAIDLFAKVLRDIEASTIIARSTRARFRSIIRGVAQTLRGVILPQPL